MQILARFLDGTSRICEPTEPWRAFETNGCLCEWCVAREPDEEIVVLVRARGDNEPVIGASVASNEPTELDARRLLSAHGGPTKLRESTSPLPVPKLRSPPPATLGFTLARLGFISDQEITSFLSQQTRIPTIDLSEYVVLREVIARVSRERCTRHRVLPVSLVGSSLIVAMVDPTDAHAIDDLKRETGCTIEPVIASEAAIQAAIQRYYDADG